MNRATPIGGTQASGFGETGRDDHGQEAPVAKPDCVRATVRLLRLEADPFERIFGFRATGTLPATEKETNDIFAAYLAQIQQVIEVVDELDESGVSHR